MKSKLIAPYGQWKSPVTIDAVAHQVVAISDITVDVGNGEIYHTERRPADARLVIVATKRKEDVIEEGFSAQCVINAYGGRPMVSRNSEIVFTNVLDHRLYRIVNGTCTAVSPSQAEWRLGDLTIHPVLDIVVCVREDHSDPSPSNVQTSLVTVNLEECTVDILAQGWDFYADPAFSPDGKKLAYTRWNHPYSAFHSMQLVVAEISVEGGSLSVVKETVVAGEPGKTVAQQPQWLSSDALSFIFDVSGYGQPWLCTQATGPRPILRSTVPEDFSQPHWFHGLSTYAVLSEKRMVCSSLKNGFARLYLLDIDEGTLDAIPSPYVDVRQLRAIDAVTVVFIGSQTEASDAIVQLQLHSASGKPRFSFEVLTQPAKIDLSPEYVPWPRDLVLTDGKGRPLHALFFQPTSPLYEAPEAEKPPAVVSFHSGPNFRPSPGFDWMRIVYTSRGWAWIDIMFGGTTGFGREYQHRLDGQWGILDVEDCAEGTRRIAALGLVDPKRVVIRGGTSGGFGVLRSSVLAPDLYAAGASFCGVADLKRLHEKTLKFQLYYIPRLVGGYPEDIPDTYRERSPLYNAAKITTPLLLVHGKLDPQVPVEQTETIAHAIRDRGGRADLIVFEDEAHGFYKAKNVKKAYQAELDLYEEVLGLTTKGS